MNWNILLIVLGLLLATFAFVFIMSKSVFAQFEKQRKQELDIKISKQIVPVKLQAYERLTLLLERITPESMVLRNDYSSLSVKQYQLVLLKAVKEEFDHNLSQQIYVSVKAWNLMLAARQSIIQLITETAGRFENGGKTVEFVTDLIDEFSEISDDPVSVAKLYLHKEVQAFLL